MEITLWTTKTARGDVVHCAKTVEQGAEFYRTTLIEGAESVERAELAETASELNSELAKLGYRASDLRGISLPNVRR